MKFEIVSNDRGDCLIMEHDDTISAVPFDESNADYQAYLASLEEQA